MDKDWFDLLDMPVSFSLDLAQLEKAYRQAQWRAHPDISSSNPTLSAQINTAYLGLKNPLQRAACLLQRFKQWPVLADPGVMQDIFHIRETGQRFSSKDMQILYAQLHTAFDQKDYHCAGNLYLRLCYLEKNDSFVTD